MTTQVEELSDVSATLVEARIVASQLESVFCSAVDAGKKATGDRTLATAICEASIKLALRIRDHAAQLRQLERRHIDGYVIGYQDPGNGKLWLIHHAMHWGNLMRCDRVESAALFPDLAAVREWAASIRKSKGKDKGGKAWPVPGLQLAGKRLGAYPVKVVIGTRAMDFLAVDEDLVEREAPLHEIS